MKIKKLILILILILVLGLVGCTRSASESPTVVPEGTNTEQAGGQQPPDNMSTAVAGGEFATQTAQAGTGAQATIPPASEPTATQQPEPTKPPTAVPTPVPTEDTSEEAASGGGCESPYTVKKGEWVWSIGRKCNISPQAIINANNLACYFDFAGKLQCPVYPGDKLTLPANAPPFVGP